MAYINFVSVGRYASSIDTKWCGRVSLSHSYNTTTYGVEIGGECNGLYMYLYKIQYYSNTDSISKTATLVKEGKAPFIYTTTSDDGYYVASVKKIDPNTILTEIPIDFWYLRYLKSGGHSYTSFSPYCKAGYRPGDSIQITDYVHCDSSSSSCHHTAYVHYSIDGVTGGGSNYGNHSTSYTTTLNIPNDNNTSHIIYYGSETPTTRLYYSAYDPTQQPGKTMPWINVNGQFKKATNMWININGQLKQI